MTDDELNERIARALGWAGEWKRNEDGTLTRISPPLPPWSTSLDACLTLPLPGGYWIRIATSPTSARCWAAIVREAQSFDGEADTPARAFATAWLEMMEAQKP